MREEEENGWGKLEWRLLRTRVVTFVGAVIALSSTSTEDFCPVLSNGLETPFLKRCKDDCFIFIHIL